MFNITSNKQFRELVQVYYPPILVTVSILGNLFVIIVYSQDKFKKLHNRNVWRLMSMVDIFCVLQIIKHFLSYAFDYQIYMENPFLCKMVSYLSHFGAISAWLRAYITSELFFSIVLVSLKTYLREFQRMIIVLIFALNLLFYSQRFYFTTIQNTNNSNEEPYCGDNEHPYFDIFLWIDLVNSTIFPFVIMFISSVLLLFAIFRSRRRLSINGFTSATQKILKRDIKFAITLIALNSTFILFNLPINVHFLIGSTSDIWYSITVNILYTSYAINFFIYFTFNSIFRKEFLNLFCSFGTKYFSISYITS